MIVVLTIRGRLHCCVVFPTSVQVQRWSNFCASRPTSTMVCDSVSLGALGRALVCADAAAGESVAVAAMVSKDPARTVSISIKFKRYYVGVLARIGKMRNRNAGARIARV